MKSDYRFQKQQIKHSPLNYHPVIESKNLEGKKINPEISGDILRITFQTSNNSFNLFNLDHFRFIDVNENFTFITGYSRNEVIGKTLSEINIWMDPEDRNLLAASLRKDGQINNIEVKFYDKNNYVIKVLISVKLVILNSPPHILTITGYIDEMKKAEWALWASQERYNNIFANIKDIYFEINCDGEILEISPSIEEIFQYKREETIGNSLYDFFVNEKQKEEFIIELKDKKRINEYEVLIRDKDSIPHPCLINATFDQDKISKNEKITGLIHDLSDQKYLEDQLKQLQMMGAAGKLADGLSHDLKNLLTVISGYSALLYTDLDKNDPIYQNVKGIENAVLNAETLTRQLQTFSRKQIFEPKVLNLHEVISDMEKMIRRVIGDEIDVYIEIKDKLGNIEVDRGQIEQVIMNLVMNARESMPNVGKMNIEARNIDFDDSNIEQHSEVEAGSYVMLAISDTGMGMDVNTKNHIFEPFFTTKPKGRGTGLGLSTVYGIVKQTGGYIWFYSELGHGTTFKIYFPRIIDEEKSEAKPTILKDESLIGNETILVVEDEEALQEIVCKTLTIYGYKVLDASNGGEAIYVSEQYKENIHLILTDVVMPKMNGKELVQHLLPQRPDMKVIYMSGYTDNVVSQQGLLDPDINYLQKPYTPKILAQKVREVLDANI